MKLKVRGDTWTFSIVTEKYFNRVHPGHEKTEAVTDTGSRVVHFKEEYFCLENVEHELGHVVCACLQLEQTKSLPPDDVEEMIVETYASVGFKNMTALSDRIFKGLKNAKRKKV